MMEDEVNNRFHAIDYLVFAFMLMISVVVGVYHASDQKTASDLLTGSRKLGIIPVAISIVASFLSSISLLGLPSESYQYGTQLFFASIITQPLAVIIAANLFLPVFYNLGVTSSYEYLEIRFNRTIRTIASVTYCVLNLFYMGVALYGPALALSQVTGINKWVAVFATDIVCTFYTTIGGMKAVVWSDVFQSIMLLGSMLVILIDGVIRSKGIGEIWNANEETGRLEFFNMDPGPYVRHTFTTVFIGTLIGHTAHYGTNQSLIQRYLSLPSLREAKKALWYVLPIKFFVYSIIAMTGLVVAAEYLFCDPLTTKRIEKADQILPLYVMDYFGNFYGIPGLFVAGVFSGSLSVISAGINSTTAVLLEDIVKTFIKRGITERQSARFVKLSSIVLGLLTLFGAIVASRLGSVIQASSTIFSLFGSPIIAIFLLGLFFPSANSTGTLIGVIFSFALNLYIGFGLVIYHPIYPNKPLSVEDCPENLIQFNTTIDLNNNTKILKALYEVPAIYRISYQYFSSICIFFCVAIALISSKFFVDEKGNLNEIEMKKLKLTKSDSNIKYHLCKSDEN